MIYNSIIWIFISVVKLAFVQVAEFVVSEA